MALRWEYRTVNAAHTLGEEEVNRLGAEGWELVSVIVHGQYTGEKWVFKRPME